MRTTLTKLLKSLLLANLLGLVFAPMCPRAASILDTTFQNRINPDSVTNAMSRLGGKTFMGGVDPAWEWVPILNPNDEFDDSVAVAGTVVNEHNSDKDLKFTHPFGG